MPQVKPPGPQLEPLDDPLSEPALDPVRTLTDVKLLSTSCDPHWGQSGLFPFEYSDMDMRISKGKLQYWHLYSYFGISLRRLYRRWVESAIHSGWPFEITV